MLGYHVRVRELAVSGLRSLAWAGDDLVDWIGGQRITLAGVVTKFGTGAYERFDAAVGIGNVGVAFETLGTKGLIVQMDDGLHHVREIDRSFYHAGDYAYPVCAFALPGGTGAIAHCPKSYDTLELETVEGRPLTQRETASADVFHSRLSASHDGRWLLSNGWVWQPWNIACVYDVARALVDPAHLAGVGISLDLGAFEAEVDAATLSGDRVIVSASAEQPMLSVIELPSGKNLHCIALADYLGTRIIAWGPDHIVALDDEPRVVALADGAVIERWPVATGSWHQPSVNLQPPKPPYVAIDPRGPRFAVADGERIVVIGDGFNS